eukprot:351645-Chlamydomonas_euryale.AAC.7
MQIRSSLMLLFEGAGKMSATNHKHHGATAILWDPRIAAVGGASAHTGLSSSHRHDVLPTASAHLTPSLAVPSIDHRQTRPLGRPRRAKSAHRHAKSSFEAAASR